MTHEEFINIYEVTTQGYKCLKFDIRQIEDNKYIASAIVEVSKDNIRREKFAFRITDTESTSDETMTYFVNLKFRFCGSSSEPLTIIKETEKSLTLYSEANGAETITKNWH